MRLVYSRQVIPIDGESLFLGGPTPRTRRVRSWRKDAVEILLDINPQITIFIPEDEDGKWDEINAEKQEDWEYRALNQSTVKMFWIPRNLRTLPGFTTNVEFGDWMRSGCVVLGAPAKAPKMSYLWRKARRYSIPVAYTLTDTIHLALQMIEQKSRTH